MSRVGALLFPLLVAAALAAPARAGDVPPQPATPAPDSVAAPAPGGRLSVEKELVDVGEVPRGKTAQATFVLRNTGTEPLHILNAKPG
jgi:hypothetical protein